MQGLCIYITLTTVYIIYLEINRTSVCSYIWRTCAYNDNYDNDDVNDDNDDDNDNDNYDNDDVNDDDNDNDDNDNDNYDNDDNDDNDNNYDNDDNDNNDNDDDNDNDDNDDNDKDSVPATSSLTSTNLYATKRIISVQSLVDNGVEPKLLIWILPGVWVTIPKIELV